MKISIDGYTMIELLVAFALFAIVLGIVTGAFLTSYRSQRAIADLTIANDNAYLAIEQMARDVRDGIDFEFSSSSGAGCPSHDCFKFLNRNGDVVRYFYDSSSKALKRSEGGNTKQLTAKNIDIRSFLVTDNCATGNPVRITLSLVVGVKDSPNVSGVNNIIQTTVSARNFAGCAGV